MPLTQTPPQFPPPPAGSGVPAAEETEKVDSAVILAIKHMSSSLSGQGTEVAEGDSCCSTLLCDGRRKVVCVCVWQGLRGADKG